MTPDLSLSPAIVYGAVLFAALLHATWNALVKSGGDKLVIQALVIFFHLPPALLLLPFVPFPTPLAWLCIAASVAIHTVYYAALVGAYRVGDLSQVYPIARGSAPLLVALGAFLVIGETLATVETLGLLLLSAGLISLAWRRAAPGAPRFDARASPVLLALVTGLMIGGYSLVDGIGGRAAESALSYIAWLFVLEPLPITLFALQRRGWRLDRLPAPPEPRAVRRADLGTGLRHRDLGHDGGAAGPCDRAARDLGGAGGSDRRPVPGRALRSHPPRRRSPGRLRGGLAAARRVTPAPTSRQGQQAPQAGGVCLNVGAVLS